MSCPSRSFRTGDNHVCLLYYFFYFMNKFNWIIISCLDFTTEGFHRLKDCLITTIEAYGRHRRKIWVLWCKTFFILRNVTIKEFETESVNLSRHKEPQHEIQKFAVADALLIGYLNKEKTGRYSKTAFFTSYKFIQWTLLVLLSQGKGKTLEMDKTWKFPAQFYSRQKKNMLKF